MIYFLITQLSITIIVFVGGAIIMQLYVIFTVARYSHVVRQLTQDQRLQLYFTYYPRVQQEELV